MDKNINNELNTNNDNFEKLLQKRNCHPTRPNLFPHDFPLSSPTGRFWSETMPPANIMERKHSKKQVPSSKSNFFQLSNYTSLRMYPPSEQVNPNSSSVERISKLEIEEKHLRINLNTRFNKDGKQNNALKVSSCVAPNLYSDSYTQTSKTILQLAAYYEQEKINNINDSGSGVNLLGHNKKRPDTFNLDDSKSPNNPRRSLKDNFLCKNLQQSGFNRAQNHQKFLEQKSPFENKILLHNVDGNTKFRSRTTDDLKQNSHRSLSKQKYDHGSLPEVGKYNHMQDGTRVNQSLKYSKTKSRFHSKRGDTFMSPTKASENKSIASSFELLERRLSPSYECIKLDRFPQGIPFLMNELQMDYSTKKNKQRTIRKSFNISKIIPINSQVTDNGGASISSQSETSVTYDSRDPLQNALLLLRNVDWSQALNGMVELVELSRILDYEQIAPELAFVNQRLIDLLRNPRSRVCRIACQAAGQLFESTKYTKRPEFDDVVDTLLCKTGDANKFVRKDANIALDTMVTHIPLVHSVRAISIRATVHKNPIVRTAAVRLLVCIVGLAGADVILNEMTNESVRKQIIVHTANFITDKYPEARKFGERLFKLLSRVPHYEFCFKKALDPDTYTKMKKLMKSLQQK